jgi:hypothetical protein
MFSSNEAIACSAGQGTCNGAAANWKQTIADTVRMKERSSPEATRREAREDSTTIHDVQDITELPERFYAVIKQFKRKQQHIGGGGPTADRDRTTKCGPLLPRTTMTTSFVVRRDHHHHRNEGLNGTQAAEGERFQRPK